MADDIMLLVAWTAACSFVLACGIGVYWIGSALYEIVHASALTAWGR